MSQPAADASSGDIVARVDFQYHWRTWALFLLVFGYGIFSLYDGFIRYPRQNADWAHTEPGVGRAAKPPHEQSSVVFNQAAGIGLTILSIPLLTWRLYRSRGAYRLSSDSLQVPGQSPIPLNQIRGLDLVRWDPKGLAVIECEGGQKLVLNDMIYQRDPTDKIVQRIEAHLTAQDRSTPA
jgi:hypothetical protein